MIDFFVCHASDDKDSIARPLYAELVRRGFSVWFDEATLKIGDSLAGEIDRGLASCRFGIVILSPAFFAKHWPQRELDGLVTREVNERAKRILPVWHEVGAQEVSRFSPTLAGKLAAQTRHGLTSVVDKIVDAAAPTRTLPPRQSPVNDGPADSHNVPLGYERQINYHCWRIARDSASQHPDGGYEFPVYVKGSDANIRAFQGEFSRVHGVHEMVTRFWEGYGELEFTYRGEHAPESIEALAIKHTLQVAQCGKTFTAL